VSGACASYSLNTNDVSVALLLVNKYKRALEVQGTEPALLQAMRDLGVHGKATFKTWLAREKEVLLALKREPVEETQAMEYYQHLVNLDAATYALFVLPPSNALLTTYSVRMRNVLATGATLAPSVSFDDYEVQAKVTRRLEAQRRHAIDLHTKAELLVNDMELRMSIGARWTSDSEEWKEAAIMVKRRRYQRALDQLQGVIIARMFELTKMNMSGTGK
jgi:hypothetical protein